MSVRPYKDKKGNLIEMAWEIDYYPEGRKGKRVQQVVHDITESQALLIEKGLRRKREGVAALVNPTITEALPDWLHWMRLHRSPKTLDSIGWAIKHLEPHFGRFTVGQVNEALVNAYKTKRKATPRSCNLELDYLKSMISWMVERKLCEPLPFKVQRLPYRRPLPKIPSPEALQQWLAEVKDPQKRAMVDLMLYSGLRFKEVTQLQWQQIDLRSRNLYLVDTKGDKPRQAILPDSVAAYLDTIGKKERIGLVFPSPKPAKDGSTGHPYTNMKTMFKGASERSGVDIKGPHTLRHICGTYTLSTTGDLRLVQTTLGHTQIRTTELYTQIDTSRMRAGQKMLSDYIGGPSPTTPVGRKAKKTNKTRPLKNKA